MSKRSGNNLPPSPNGEANGNGRDDDGRFAKGNPGGPGNPHAAAVGKARSKFYASLKANDVPNALRTIRRVMKSGKPSEQLAAALALLDRTLGKPASEDLLTRIEALEARFASEGRLS